MFWRSSRQFAPHTSRYLQYSNTLEERIGDQGSTREPSNIPIRSRTRDGEPTHLVTIPPADRSKRGERYCVDDGLVVSVGPTAIKVRTLNDGATGRLVEGSY